VVIGEHEAVVGFAVNTGNPESAIIVAFHHNLKIRAGYMDAKQISIDLSQYDCLASSVPVYFVSREQQLAGFEKFLEFQQAIHNPYSTNSIGIYRLRSPCQGKEYYLNI
jgi:hypothetical protein